MKVQGGKEERCDDEGVCKPGFLCDLGKQDATKEDLFVERSDEDGCCNVDLV